MDDNGSFVVWDLRDWDGDVETMKEINDAWLEVHEPPEKSGTISVFPEHVVVNGEIQEYISDGWNDAADAAGLDHLAIVADGLQGMAVQNHIEMDGVDTDTFEDVESAKTWMESLTE